ncbi:MAG TPA: tRNA epoxyqueuosine(34) reductase QueG [Acidimicrobiales bacterium]|nr:tRNA epoxyqueuosine(34) reductase QueG [Acidimicrobiales bacterium]
MPPGLAEEVRKTGLEAGLDAVGVAPARPFEDTRRHLEERRQAGLHGGMAFTYRNPARSTEPERILPGAQAIVVGARRYPSRRSVAGGESEGGGQSASRPMGVVARYASADYYQPLRDGLAAVADRLRAAGFRATVVADDNALVDRAAAHRAGLGWYGKNTNLLLPGNGSWFVLGSVVTDAALPSARQPLADGCGSCRRCLPACPTGALVAPGVLDARRCLAWLVQAPGVFPREYRAALGARLYGCDDCQEVCPENVAADRAAAAADGRITAHDTSDSPAVDLLELLAASDDELMGRHGRWYIPRRQPRYLRRNALVALGNIADGRDPDVEMALRRALADPDPILRAHAVWAASRLARPDLIAPLIDDDDPTVRQEIAWANGDLT